MEPGKLPSMQEMAESLFLTIDIDMLKKDRSDLIKDIKKFKTTPYQDLHNMVSNKIELGFKNLKYDIIKEHKITRYIILLVGLLLLLSMLLIT